MILWENVFLDISISSKTFQCSTLRIWYIFPGDKEVFALHKNDIYDVTEVKIGYKSFGNL